ncbi:helix-turn-helix domain-containing protein [Amphibacillus sediminis]|uniref:helix-turn-helix domain-containing protein n=1 Tax=Amphibacillus sediminis TaxID=360185 RepID=UPI000832EEF3|nr:helix-turn-helix domain-containing protein [Amphibacillus sediminis]
MFYYLILHGLQRIEGQRSPAAIYHLLQGRRSAQTIQDGNLYQLSEYFACYPTLSRADFNHGIVQLIEKDWIKVTAENLVYLTGKSHSFLNKYSQSFPLHYLHGGNYARAVPLFMKRIYLAIQTYTHLSVNNRNFDPIIDDYSVQNWIKSHYQQNRYQLKEWLIQLYDSLNGFLITLDSYSAELFVKRITAYQRIGATIQQLAWQNNCSIHDIEIRLMAIFQHLLFHIDQHHLELFYPLTDYPFSTNVGFMTASAQKTYQMLKHGWSKDNIASRRGLRPSTVEDHIVEIVYADPAFQLSAFIDEKSIGQILEAIKVIQDHKLSSIKAFLNHQFSYFQIRLVLARYDKDKKKGNEV